MKLTFVFAFLAFLSIPVQAVTTEIADSTGDGSGNTLDVPVQIGMDPSGNVYVGGLSTDNVFRITPAGAVHEIIDETGDGTGVVDPLGNDPPTGNYLDRATGIAVDSSGNVYVAGQFSDNVFRIAASSTCSTTGSACDIEEIADDGVGGVELDTPLSVTTDSNQNVYVGTTGDDNVLRILNPSNCNTAGSPASCTIDEIMDSTGDGGSNTMDSAQSLKADSNDNIYVVGTGTDNAFRVTASTTCSTTGTPCSISEIIDSTGAGGTVYDFPRDMVIDSSDNVYIAAHFPVAGGALWKIEASTSCSTGGSACTVRELVNSLGRPIGVAVDTSGNVYVGESSTDQVTKVNSPTSCHVSGTPCTTSTVITSSGDGLGAVLDGPASLLYGSNALFVVGQLSDNVFKVEEAAGNDCTISATTVTGPITFTGMDMVQSEDAISTSGNVTVANGADVLFEAPNSIALDDEFNVENGGEFTARIDNVVCP